jgi:hypothetical protein
MMHGITTADGARAFAVDWQVWQAGEAMTWSEVAQWQADFTELANKFDLTEEFQENGII